MSRIFLYKNKNTPLTQTYFFSGLIEEIKRCPENVLLFLDSEITKKQITQLIINELPNTPHLPIIITKTEWFKDQRITPTSKELFIMKSHLRQCIHQLSCSQETKSCLLTPTIFNQCLQYFLILKNNSKDKFKTTKTNAKPNAEFFESCDILYELLWDSLESHGIKWPPSTSFKNKINKFHKKSAYLFNINHLWPEEKKLIKKTIESSLSTAILIDEIPEENNIETWIHKTFKPKIINEPTNSNHTNNFKHITCDTQQDEINWIIKTINKQIKQHAQTKVHLIIPNSNNYEHIVKKELKKQKINFSTDAQPQFNSTTLYRFFSNLCNFLYKPTTLKTIDTLVSSPFAKKHTINQSELILDIQFIEQSLHLYEIPPSKNILKDINLLIKKLDYKIKRNPELTRVKDKLNQHIPHLESFINSKERIQKSKTISHWCQHIAQFIESWNIIQTIHLLPNDQQLITYKHYSQLIINIGMFETLALTMPNINFKKALGYKLLLEFIKEKPIASSSLAIEPVHISSLKNIFTSTATLSIICGACLDCYPQETNSNTFFSNSKNIALTPPNIQLTHHENKKKLINILKNSQQLILTTPKQINNTDTLPAHFLTPPNHSWNPEHIQKTPPDIDSETNKTPSPATLSKFTNKTLLSDIKHHIYKNTISPTQLNDYQQCPYAYYLKYVLNLSSYKEQIETLSKTEWGIFLHDIMADFNKALQKETLSPSKIHLQTILKSLFLNAFEKKENKNFFWHLKKIEFLGNKNKQGLIETISELYASTPYLQSPAHIEKSQKIILDDHITLKGKHDVIYTTPEGDFVLDYKTGKKLATASDIKELRSLQLPIYLLLLKEHSEPIGAMLFQIHSELHCKNHIICTTQHAKQEVFKLGRKRPFIFDEAFFIKIKTHIKTLITMMLTGQFLPDLNKNLPHMHNQRKTICSFCEYKLVCRYKERFAS